LQFRRDGGVKRGVKRASRKQKSLRASAGFLMAALVPLLGGLAQPAQLSLTTNTAAQDAGMREVGQHPAVLDTVTNRAGPPALGVQGLRERARTGDAEAQAELASIYYEGRGVTQDYAEAVKWWMYAENRNAEAQRSLIAAYKRWIAEAENGGLKAQVALGTIYIHTSGYTSKAARLVSFQDADRWFRMAAEQGGIGAQVGLGIMYRCRADDAVRRIENESAPPTFPLPRARFTPEIVRDYAEAAKWYRMAAETGCARAQVGLGALYRDGYGVPQDYAQAVRWFRRAATQGHMSGQSNLGSCYENGTGVPQDFAEAYKWVNLADAQFGTHEARDRLAERMTPEQIAEGQRRSSRFVAKEESPGSAAHPPGEATAEPSAPRASGTGFFITDDGYLLTSYHVIEDADRILLRTGAGTVPARVVASDKANDVALLKAVGKFSALPVRSSRGVKLGESVFTIGFPNVDLQGFSPKLTKGEISSLSGAQDDPRHFQISVAVQPGNSGGPIVDRHGNVVGAVEARLSDLETLRSTGSLPQNVNYALKGSVLSVLLESIPEISTKLKDPNPSGDRGFEDVVKETEGAVALVLIY
jgi:TPR repeat protein